jgi:hypothetical protein
MSNNKNNDDWRWQGTTTTAPFQSKGRVLPAGEILRLMTPLQVFGSKISLPVPNASALLFNLSSKQWAQSQELKQRMGNQADVLHQQPSLCMDFFESVMSSAVLAFACLESFSNNLIPPNAEYQERKKRKGIFRVKSKATIERWNSTEDKLGTILPKLLSFDSPKGTSIWDDFKALKATRDRIVHFKTADQSFKVDDEHLWAILVDNSCPNYPEISYSMLDFVCSKISNPPLWFKQLKKEREQIK